MSEFLSIHCVQNVNSQGKEITIRNPVLTNILSIFRHPQQQQHHQQHPQQQQYDKYGLINNPAYAIDNALKKNSAPLPAIMAPNTGAVQVIWVVEFPRELG